MAYNVCVNCGFNLNLILYNYLIEKRAVFNELFAYHSNKHGHDEALKLVQDDMRSFNNIFFVKYSIDRLCDRGFLIGYIDYQATIL
jgi:hypothetical protein